MSSYRDDAQETAVASSSTWIGLQTITGESAKVAAAAIFTLGVLHADQAVVGDEVIDQGLHVVQEQAVASAAVVDHQLSLEQLADTLMVSEHYRHTTRVMHSDSATAADDTGAAQRSVFEDSAGLIDQVIGRRSVWTLVEEAARLSDFSGQAMGEWVDESALIADTAGGAVHASHVAEEVATAADSVQDSGRKGIAPSTDLAVMGDETSGVLHAADLLVDWGVIEGGALGTDLDGQAWTACVDGWAMSRYQPYSFERIAVIDGVLYGESPDGVYALSGGTETIAARVRTGQLDLSGGSLTHPIAAYLEYELSGTAEMSVTTTQTGTAKSYTYSLPPEVAEHLTNGRFQFGRGLRGRHFAFELRMTGEHGRVNDLSIQTAQGRRRI